MTTATAVVTNIQGYSIHDGPGIRTVVFLKGCPLRCQWCANPENLTKKVQVGFLKSLCTGCGRCAKACAQGAIRLGKDEYRIDRAKCTDCLDCVDACYYGALVRYGAERTAEDVYAEVRRDKMFYDSSGGGVTLSGGEPLTNPDFAFELCSLCHGEGINTCIETCGNVPQATFEKMLPVVDYFYFDLKLMDGEAHKKYTGADNKLILSNARYIVGQGAKVLFRQPLIPGVNDGEENIRATAEFMKSLKDGGMDIQLMPYHRMGQTKYAALELPYPAENIRIMSAGEIDAVCGRYNALGVRCTVSR